MVESKMVKQSDEPIIVREGIIMTNESRVQLSNNNGPEGRLRQVSNPIGHFAERGSTSGRLGEIKLD